jgi:hypothetical protein
MLLETGKSIPGILLLQSSTFYTKPFAHNIPKTQPQTAIQNFFQSLNMGIVRGLPYLHHQ